MTSDILGVSISGLRVSQNALRTAGHNIANANTEGYSRQSTEINSLGGTASGVGFLGNGAYTNNIDRVVNEFVTTQVRQDTTLYNQLNVFNQNVLQLNDLLANESTGLSQGIQSFFAAVQTATDDPTSIAARQLYVSEASNLSDRFSTLASRIDSINDGVNQALEVGVVNINNLTSNIAQLNNSIASFSGSTSSSPNDLLDQRDEALRRLSEIISVNLSIQDDNQVNITVGNGIPLVLGSESTAIRLEQNQYEPEKIEVVIDNDTINQSISDAFSGGQIGGLFEFQQTVIEPTYNEVGRLSIAIADTFNQLQQQGLNLHNTFGQPIFADINAQSTQALRVMASANNLSDNTQLGLAITDSTQITTSNYLMSVDDNAGIYRVTRLSDNAELVSALIPTTFPSTVEFDGLSLSINGGEFSGGDTFLIQPTRQAAHNFTSTGLTPEDIALASPLKTNTSVGNLGDASISAGDILGLEDASGNTLNLFSQAGQMSPPLLVKFTTATTYDILDNSDPGNPIQLSPPIRNQVYVPGVSQALFSEDQGSTSVSTTGSSIGLPTGSTQATQAAVKPSSTPPSFAVTDFSGTANQFSFDIIVSNTDAGANDGTFSVSINAAGITDNASLLTTINDQLSLAGSRVRAYISDAAQGGALAFASLDHGVGDITLQNYNNDPDGNLDLAPIGQANALLGFDIEGSTFTSIANANGISGIGVPTNNYAVETFTIVTTDPTNGTTSSQNIFTTEGASAKTIASSLSNVNGVSANAFNYMEFRNASLALTEPLQLSLNNEALIAYENSSISSVVPSPTLNNSEDFNDYLADKINSNVNLQAQGIYAVSAYDSVNGEFYVQVHSTQGDDFAIELTAAATAGGSISVNDGDNANVALTGSGTHTTSQLVVGGRIDVELANNVSFSTTPETSTLFGNSTSQVSYLGIQATLRGAAQAGDTFTLDFNANAASDNRNGLAMIALQQSGSIDGGSESFQEAYNQLVETIGITASTSQNNTAAAENVLEQTQNLRNSISGVNLDEEAADLIRYEQLYSANAQVITVARDLFDRLLGSF